VSRKSVALAALILGCLVALPAQAQVRKTDHVRLQLKWFHQFQFAGYYMAKAKGYYAEEGLDVEIAEASPETAFTEEVVSGRADFGIQNSDILLDRAEGAKVVVLAVIFQHSPLVLLTAGPRRAETPQDLAGKRVMVSRDAEAEIYSMFRSEGIGTDSLLLVPHSWNLEDLVTGRVDAVSAYTTNEALSLEERGIAHSLIRPLTYGIDFYGDCLFTSEAEIRKHPARVAAFLRASLKGWNYALDHVEESCDLILSAYGGSKTKGQLLAEAKAMDDLILHKFVPVGTMNPGRWKHIASTYESTGQLKPGWSLDGFLYDPTGTHVNPTVLRAAAAAALASLFLALAAIAYILSLRAFNRRLAKEVDSRTAALQGLNADLEREVVERREKEKQLAATISEKDVLLKEVHHRVKNNLQVIASLISLEMGAACDAGECASLTAIRDRIYGMALVHEQLYRGDGLASIDMDNYLSAVAAQIVQSWSTPGVVVSVAVEPGSLALPVEKAIPCGLIAGELISNSMKHAFSGRSSGHISLGISRGAGGLSLRVTDDGVGQPPDLAGEGDKTGAAREKVGIGLELVRALSAQLGGAMTAEIQGGRTTRVDFPA
jgi:two-component sensor histidine kinase/ABC-type nitrate/sulfonate/bicarbonate transport system substrate-binding protein